MITGIKNLLTSLWVKSHDFFGFKKFISLLSLGFVTLVLVLSFLASSLSPIRDLKTQKAEAATSSTLNFQARLLNSSGNLVADGYYNIRFKLYDGGTQGGGAGKGQTLAGTQLWTESYYDSNGVTAGNDNRVRVANGYFSVNLGSQTAFPSINWDEELWLTMDIGGTTQTATPTYDGEMLSTIPAANSRLKLTAVPYAFRAGQLAKTTSSFNSTLDFATQTASRSILLPDASGTVCLQNATACGFATATGAAGYIQNSTSLQTTANFNIQSAGAASVGGVIRAATSQTADLFQLQDSSGAILTAFQADGKLVFGPSGAQDTNLYRSAANTLKTDDNLIVGDGVSSKNLTIQGNSWNGTVAIVNSDTGSPYNLFYRSRGNLGAETATVSGDALGNLGFRGHNGTAYLNQDGARITASAEETFTLTSQATRLSFYTAPTGSISPTERLRISSTGNIGLGTTSTTAGLVNVGTNTTSSSGGIYFGTDTNLYRSAADTLTTDDSLIVTGLLTANGNLTLQTGDTFTINGDALTDLTGSGLSVVSNALTVDATSSTGFFRNGGNSFGAAATLGTNDGNVLNFETNNTNRFQIASNASKLTGQGVTEIDSTGALFLGGNGSNGIAIGNSSVGAGQIAIGNTSSVTSVDIQASTTLNLGGGGVANTIQIGNITGAVSQNINIGTNATGSSTNNVNIGSSVAGTTAITGTTTVTGRTSGSSTALTVNNSTSTGSIFVAQDNGTAVMTIADGGGTTFRTTTDTKDALKVTNSGGDTIVSFGTTTAAPNANNLIKNSSFEGSSAGWNAKNGSGLGVSSINLQRPPSGFSYLNITTSATGHGTQYPVTLTASTSYVLSAYVKVGSGTMTTLVLGRQDQSGTDIDCAASPTITTSWQRVSCSFTTGGTISSSNIYIKQSDATGRNIHVDAVQLIDSAAQNTFYQSGDINFNSPITSALTVAGTNGSGVQMFQVQNAAGTTYFGVDTSLGTVNVTNELATPSTTFNLLNTTATTINAFGAASTLNLGPTGATATSINLAGGSGATGCTVDGATGNLTCSGAISTTATTGTQGWWSRSGTTLQPATAGDNITTTGNISTTSTGTITSAGLLTANGGLTVETGDTFTMNGDAFTDLTGSGLNVTSNALTVDATSATGFFRNGGNSFAGAATIGTNDGNVLNVETNNSTRFQVSASASTLTGQGTTILTSTGSLDLSSAAASNLSITAGTTGTLALDTGTTGGITIGNNGNAKTITIGNSTGATAVNLQAGTNGVSIAANGIANTVQIGNTSGAVTQSINIGTNATASSTNNVNIGSSIAGTTAITGSTTITNRTSGSTDTLIVSNSTSTGNIFVARDNATAVMTIADGGATTFSNTNTSAFVIQNASSQSLLVANTSTQRLAVGPAAVAANGVLTVGTSSTTTASGGVYFGTDTNLYRYGAGQLASDGSIISTTGNFYTTGAGTGLLFGNTNTSGIINALANGAGDMYFYNGSASPVLTLTQTGTALFRNSTNSTVAFQIQSASGSDTMFIADTTATNKIKIGNSTGTGTATTIFQLDGAASAPFGTGQTAYLGSMYYDTTQGKLQCYEDRNGTAAWGACGSAPNNIITLTPEYTGAVLNGTGVGTMTADFCSNESGVLVVGTLCANHETRNFYKWTSPQGTNQTYSIYVNYKLPTTFNSFEDANTIKLTALSDNLTNASATLQVLRKNVAGNAISSCGSATTINSTVSTWQQTSFGGNETTCGFVGGDYVIFKIDVTAKSGANVYVENLDFTYRNT